MRKEGRLRVCKRLEGEPSYPSKNLIAERNRRNRIQDRLFTLRSLVPKITKMDKASTLGDAVNYIVELKGIVKRLQDELKEPEEQQQDNKDIVRLQIPNSTGLGVQDNSGDSYGSSSINGIERPSQKQKVEVEVKKVGAKEFHVRVCCEQRIGGFSRLVEAMNGLGLLITDVNVVNFRGKVSSVLIAEANCEEIQAHHVRENVTQALR